ncbi:MAG: hypothetical protein K8I29_19580 [Alphaproteobacteria bacterium]|uniref:Uncharacterized protein n=1 Tax=Candidatus Nitrobium versatile TaxID=2884831 RepID=A0A953M3P8_9BACT|nr:hypothetical protein [Candidatus Nitrobium versatile]
MDERTKDVLAQEHLNEFKTCEDLRRDKETEWLEDLRAAKGIYDPDVEAKIPKNASRVYPKYTRSKEVPCVAKLNNMLFPPNDRNWEIQPTPSPEISSEKLTAIARSLITTAEDGTLIPPSPDQLAEAVMGEAKESCRRMSITIDDQLTELQYKAKAKKVIKSAVRFGTGIFKGPLTQSTATRRYERAKDGGYTQVEDIAYRPFLDYVQLWYWYPDMTATELDDCYYFYELHPMTKHDLRGLAKKKGFDAAFINAYLRAHPNGDYRFRFWEIDLQNMGKGKANNSTVSRKYEVLERWGWVDGADLERLGVPLPEGDAPGDKEYWMNTWILGGKIIKASFWYLPETERVYHVFYFDKDESSIFGTGLPRTIRDSQISISSATRMLLDNAARVSGPQVEANKDLMPDEDIDDMYPGRIWQREGRGTDAQYPALRVYSLDSHIEEYLQIIQRFENNGDMESTLPAFLWGEPAGTSNETAKGISIRSSNVNLTVNDLVDNFDACTESILSALYAWNMEFNPEESIKGDFKVKARGSSSLLSKEVRTQALDFFATTLTELDEPYIKRHALLKNRIKLHDLDPSEILRSEEEARSLIEAQRDPEMEGIMKDKEMAETEYTRSKAAHMLAKARTTMTEKDIRAIETAARVQSMEHEDGMKAIDRQLKAAEIAGKGGDSGNGKGRAD